jgi:hypothetical protein
VGEGAQLIEQGVAAGEIVLGLGVDQRVEQAKARKLRPTDVMDVTELAKRYGKYPDNIVYELKPHMAPLSHQAKELGEIDPHGNPEKGRVMVSWEVVGGDQKWTAAIPENNAADSIDRYAAERPLRFHNPVVYDLVKVSP